MILVVVAMCNNVRHQPQPLLSLTFKPSTNYSQKLKEIIKFLINQKGVINLHSHTFRFVEKLDPKMLVRNY